MLTVSHLLRIRRMEPIPLIKPILNDRKKCQLEPLLISGGDLKYSSSFLICKRSRYFASWKPKKNIFCNLRKNWWREPTNAEALRKKFRCSVSLRRHVLFGLARAAKSSIRKVDPGWWESFCSITLEENFDWIIQSGNAAEIVSEKTFVFSSK